MMPPRATYRLQLSSGSDFDQAAALADYLRNLGISHLYTSPILAARSDSTHGYDVVDSTRLSSELGGEVAFTRLTRTLVAAGIKLLVDFIPNHMGVGGSENAIWLDVLEWGPDSAYADWFDIDWLPGRSEEPDKIVLPLLGNQYGVELERGALRLKFHDQAGSFAVWAYETHKLPICPLHYATIWGKANRELIRLGDAFTHLPSRYRAPNAAEELRKELAKLVSRDADLKRAIASSVEAFQGQAGAWDSWRRLDRLIQLQHWRPAYFRVASDDINYRRFFNINELAAIRMENPAVFDYAHRKVFDLMRTGRLHGLRIDHVDGLRDPLQYLRRIEEAIHSHGQDCYVVVEKILARHETLREEWPAAGTTGYDFMAQVTGVLIDKSAESALSRIYREFSGDTQDFPSVLRASKLEIVSNEMAGELRALSRDAAVIARQSAHTADFTQNVLERALRQIVGCFPVYRTYVDPQSEASAEDRRDLQWAVEQARLHEMAIDQSVFDFLLSLLTGDVTRVSDCPFSHSLVYQFLMRFQQYTVPVMAKGLEDTAFYRYPRLFALSEVGNRPDQFGVSVSTFHKANAQRQKRWPNAMLASSTHDTKLGEDARARLAVIAEMPEEWERQVKSWTRLLRAPIGGVEGDAPPDRQGEYLFYQLLLASWPPQMSPAAEPAHGSRLRDAMLKAAREAKLSTSWVTPNIEYESALAAFVDRALDVERSHAFLDLFRPFQEQVAWLGMRNSIIQTVLKLTSPGVPDIYQGSEAWNFSLMDPDNRRPVDFTRLRELAGQSPCWQDGSLKLSVISKLLRLREESPMLFSQGDYQPLTAEGPRTDHVIAFTRTHESTRLLVVCSRFPGALERLGWEDTRLTLPPGGAWRDCLSGNCFRTDEGGVALAALLPGLPAAVLEACREAT